MADFYKFEIANWNEGTANLSLEQDAAFLRVVNAIRLSGQPITYNIFVLCGLWRCNKRKAKRILAELVEAGKLMVEAGKIINEKAVDDASTRSRAGVEAGSKAETRAASHWKTKKQAKHLLQPEKRREEKRREEKRRYK